MKKIICILIIGSLLFTACGTKDKAVQKVIGEIEDIGKVELNDEEKINKAYNHYNQLTDNQKEQVENYVDLMDAMDEIEQLKIEGEKTPVKDENVRYCYIVTDGISKKQKNKALKILQNRGRYYTDECSVKCEKKGDKELIKIILPGIKEQKAFDYVIEDAVLEFIANYKQKNEKVILDYEDLKKGKVFTSYDNESNKVLLSATFNSIGRKKLLEGTKEHKGTTWTVVYNKQVLLKVTINQIMDTDTLILGHKLDQEEARMIAHKLNIGNTGIKFKYK